ncbi:hypothetical protein BDW22DRAFT_185251 [Trametopsis cervina]|nr:hypothetical protein BDW22DRAFT_185251 [Trametopsis cervina]
MPSVRVNHQGAVLHYEDSGVPFGSKNYHTVFLLHGFLIHGATFRPLFPYASGSNLRFITLNMREYPGSSPLTDTELDRFQSPDVDLQAAALRDQGIEVANAIAHLIYELNIPSPNVSRGQRTGGTSIVAWSQSNAYVLAILANTSKLDPRVNSILEQHLRIIFLYDPPSMVLGKPLPPGISTVFSDPKLPPAEMPTAFFASFSLWFNPLPVPDAVNPRALQTRYEMREVSPDPRYVPISLRMSADELASVTSPEIAPRVTMFSFLADEVFAENLRRAIGDTRGAWKEVKIVMLCPDMTHTVCSFGCKLIHDLAASAPTNGTVKRDCETVQLPGRNHFWHHEQPQEFVDLLARYTQVPRLLATL